jgi:hypothetical protein
LGPEEPEQIIERLKVEVSMLAKRVKELESELSAAREGNSELEVSGESGAEGPPKLIR